MSLVRYGAGLLGDGGGGDIAWWHDYIRAELERAHEHYEDRAADALEAKDKEIERLRGAVDRWALELMGAHHDLTHQFDPNDGGVCARTLDLVVKQMTAALHPIQGEAK